MRYAMIMAGGSGTRLWPLSRRARPKQLLPLIDGRSLLDVTVARLEGLVPPEHRYICTGERYREMIRAGLPGFDDTRILGEPVGRDTVNAIGFTAAVLARIDPEAVFVVLTSDHLIEPVEEFRRKIDTGFGLVEADPARLVTFAVTPTFAADSYGYVERGTPLAGFADAYEARHFKEKPDRATAESYLATGTFGWNSGMFVYHAGTFMDALGRHLPEARAGLERIANAWGTPDQAATLDAVYPSLPRISVDYAIMEPAIADRALSVCVVSMAVSWMDVGSWPSYAKTLAPRDDGHRANCRTHHLGSSNVLAVSDDPSHTITTIGCRDLVVVHSADATLVCPMSEAERVKDLAGEVDETLQ